MKVKNTITGKVYPDIVEALKSGCVSNTSLASAIHNAYTYKSGADANLCAADLCQSANFFWEVGIQWVAEYIERYGNYNQFNLKPLEVAFVKGDTVMITDVGQIYNHYSDVFSNYEAYGLTLQDVAEWCYGDLHPDLYSYYTVKALFPSFNKEKILYIKSKTNDKGYLISPEGVRKVEK